MITKKLLFSLFLLISVLGFGQRQKSNLGFTIAAKSARLIADVGEDVLFPGVGIGIFMEKKLTRSLSLMPRMELSANNTWLVFKEGFARRRYAMVRNSFDWIMHFKYKFLEDESCPLVLAGISIKESKALSRSSQFDLAWDFGICYEITLGKVRFTPEFRGSVGTKNINWQKEFGKITMDSVSLVFNFSKI